MRPFESVRNEVIQIGEQQSRIERTPTLCQIRFPSVRFVVLGQRGIGMGI
jgi:hypothetical protein